MKSFKNSCIVAVALLLLVGCGKKIDVVFPVNTFTVAPEGEEIMVALNSNGEWTVDATPEWIQVSPNSGNGDATLTLTVGPNRETESRTGEVRVSSKDNSASLTVNQDALGFFIDVNPNRLEFDQQGGSSDVTVSSNVEWTIISVPEWITCQASEETDFVTVAVGELTDPSISIRSGEVVFGNDEVQATLAVLQHSGSQSYISILPETLLMRYEGETKEVSLFCGESWTAEIDGNPDWITLSPMTGEGDADILVTVTENPYYTVREVPVVFTSASGLISKLVVTQEATPNPHFLEVNPDSFSFGKQGGEAVMHVSCDKEWSVRVDSDWASVSETEGNGDADVNVVVAPNVFSEPRSCEVIVESDGLLRRINVNQEPGDELLYVNMSPDTLYVSNAGGGTSFEIASNTTWNLTVESLGSWLILTSGTSGEGDALIGLVVDYNPTSSIRTGIVKAFHNGELMDEIVVVQEAKQGVLEVSMTEINATAEAEKFFVDLEANQHWTISTDALWVKCTPDNGNGNEQIVVAVDPMPIGQNSRSAHIQIVGELGNIVVITVNQTR